MSATDAVTRLNAALSGRYEIERELGEGGMATVYLARDLKHNRNVALKVLKPELAAVVGADRFLAEIETTANLQHPHILPLFDSGEADGFLFYVMPFVEGETLRERLGREKQLGIEDALALAAKLCDALDYAHSEGVIHRDIKPANILLSKRGEPLVADFGIALAVAQAGGGRITETGLSLGTPHYMSPEQATGDSEVDPRSDVYALGCVLHEMLTGEPPFTASTAQAVLAKILTMDAPSITMVRRTVPANVSAAVAKALEKLPADRFTTASDFGAALSDPAFVYATRVRGMTAAHPGGVRAAPGAPVPWVRDRRSVATLAVVLLASALAAWGWLRPAPAPDAPPAVRTELTTPDDAHWVEISPDGRWLVTRPIDQQDLFVRGVAEPEWRPLPNSWGSSRAQASSFSPDGAWVLMDAGLRGLLRFPVSGGPALSLANPGSRGHWGGGDVIVYDDRRGSIYRRAASGGEPELLLTSDTLAFKGPRLLPEGRGILVTTRSIDDPVNSRLLVYETESGELRELVESATDVRYVPTGHLIYSHASGALLGVPFDLQSLRVTGPSVSLVSDLALGDVDGEGNFSVSETGTLVYSVPGQSEDASLSWMDLSGRETPIPIEPGRAELPKISPDGRSIAYVGDDRVWIHDVSMGFDRQFSFGRRDSSPVWSPDGRYIYFVSDALDGGRWTVVRRPVDGSSEPEEIVELGQRSVLTSVSPDGRWLVFQQSPSEENAWRVTLFDLQSDPGASSVPYLEGEEPGIEASVSPDGKWLAYGGGEIFVRGFPSPSGLWRIARGREPVWARDGRTLYFWGEGDIQAVDVQTDPTFSVGAPYTLVRGGRLTGGPGVPWDAHPDGDRFVVARPIGEGSARRFFIVTNWFTELRERMGESNR